MNRFTLVGVKQAIAIPALALINISIGLFVSDYSVVSQRMSELAHESQIFAYTHRLVDILIGFSMCLFAICCFSIAKAKFTFLTIFSFGLTWVFAGIFILGNPLHDIYGLTTVLLVVPVIFSIEMRDLFRSRAFEDLSILVTLIHVVFFWFYNYGFMPVHYNGIIQRVWVFITLSWYGVAAYHLASVANEALQSTAHSTRDRFASILERKMPKASRG